MDNVNDFTLYNSFIITVSGSTLVRITWMGEERENSHLTIQFQSGLVEHIPIPYKFIDGFLKGEFSYGKFIEKKISKGVFLIF
jgi:hypothetical protein